MAELTSKQSELHVWMLKFQKEGWGPASVREIAESIGWDTKTTFLNLVALERLGKVETRRRGKRLYRRAIA